MKNRYSPSEFAKNVYSLAMTRLFMSQARFIRRPVFIRGKASITGGKGLTLGRFCRFDLEGTSLTLHIGDNCEMGDMTHIVAYNSVSIGDNVLIASKCFISDTNHGSYRGDDQSSPYDPPNIRPLKTAPVKIGSNVWIGENAVVLAGSTIGDGSIVGANSVVSGTYPERVILAGVPARIIKQWDDDSQSWVHL